MKWFLFFWSAYVILALAIPAFGIPADKSSDTNLELTIHCPEKDIRRGDEIPIVFTITNRGKAPYSYDTRGYDRSGRMMEYELVAKDKGGTVVADPRADRKAGLGGGLSSGMASIRTGQSFTKTVALNRWALINKAGKYTVTGTYYYYTEDPLAKQVKGMRRMKEVAVESAPIQIVVKPRSHRQMGRYIKTLLQQLKAIQPSTKWEIVRQREAILAKLAYTCDRRIVPTLIDLWYKNYHQNEVFWAAEAFVCYLPREQQIKNRLIAVAKKRGLADSMRPVLEVFGCSEEDFQEIIAKSLASDNLRVVGAGAGAAQDHPHDDRMPALIAIVQNDAEHAPDNRLYEIARDRAIYAIGRNRTDEGVQALKALLKHPDKDIRRTTAHAIKRAYKYHRAYPKRSHAEYTAALVPIALDCNDPRQTFMIAEVARSRSREGVKAIKALLENAAQDLPIAETDQGVGAIRDLLRSPDKDVREMTRGILEVVYRDHPGRALRKDDFGQEFRETFEQRKKRLLNRLKQQ